MIKEISHESLATIRRRLQRLYPDRAENLVTRFYHLVGRYGVGVNPGPPEPTLWNQTDAWVIIYADTVQSEGEAPLKVLRRFLTEHLRGAFSTVHILPFYPWSSDDGFSVKDYRQVQSDYGTWEDVKGLGRDFKLMFDLVLNHCSRQSGWFQDFVKGVQPARDFFHPVDPTTDLSAVVRPRPTPLLSKVQTRHGTRHVWATFSADQVDLNWTNADVLFEFLDILFWYLAQGARVIRLDAVAFLWKQIGTSCLHLPETHEVVKLIRDVLAVVAPQVIVLTETNVPHEENISYFGNGDEAHMVYQFSLPPLLLHGLLNDNATHLRKWAENLSAPPPGCTYLNFTASHDGVGVRPLTGLVPDRELDALIQAVEARGGEVSWRDMGDGTRRPYELNITWFSALSEPGNLHLGRQRFLCSQAVALSLQGVPAVYFNCLFADTNWKEGRDQTGQKRTLNRRKWQEAGLKSALAQEESEAGAVFQELARMLRRRAEQPAFHPDAGQRIPKTAEHLLAVVRTAQDESQTILCVYNFSRAPQRMNPAKICHPTPEGGFRDILRGFTIPGDGRSMLKLEPYQAAWLVVN